jgi:tryptophan-rich sensory protein
MWTNSIPKTILGAAVGSFAAFYATCATTLFSFVFMDPMGGYLAAILLLGGSVVVLRRTWIIRPVNHSARIILLFLVLGVVVGVYLGFSVNQSLQGFNDFD